MGHQRLNTADALGPDFKSRFLFNFKFGALMSTNIPIVKLPAIPNACAYRHEISDVRVILPDGQYRHFQGSRFSNGFFSRIIASRDGIIKLLVPALPEPLPENQYVKSCPNLQDRGLYILPVDFSETDWLLAVEEQICTCDPGWAYHLLYGKLPDGMKNTIELYSEIFIRENLAKTSGGTMPFQEFQLWPVAPATT